jgi:hypothetical protein
MSFESLFADGGVVAPRTLLTTPDEDARGGAFFTQLYGQ